MKTETVLGWGVWLGLFPWPTKPSERQRSFDRGGTTNHFARLIDVLARPEFSPVSDAVVEEQAWMAAPIRSGVAVNAPLRYGRTVLSTDDDMVLPARSSPSFFIRPLGAQAGISGPRSSVADHEAAEG